MAPGAAYGLMGRPRARTPSATQARCWEAVVRLGSQTAAARELGVTQGAVRGAILAYSAITGEPIPKPARGRPSGVTRARITELEATIARLREAVKRRGNRSPSEPWEPACMDASDWTDWQRFNERAGSTMRAQRPCDDCPMSFALEMFAARRCNGVPGQD